jgi:hypothetical protein
MKIKKFRVWDNFFKKFYNFELNNITFPERLLDQCSCNVQQFIGILDSRMKEIYEGDVVNFDYFNGDKTATGVVQYNNSYCAYVVDSDIGTISIMYISLDSLEIIGNMVEDYMWDEGGEKLVKYENK